MGVVSDNEYITGNNLAYTKPALLHYKTTFKYVVKIHCRLNFKKST